MIIACVLNILTLVAVNTRLHSQDVDQSFNVPSTPLNIFSVGEQLYLHLITPIT